MIHVLATVELKPGCRADFLKHFHALVPLVHAEAGCLAYGPAVDLATGLPAQGSVRDDVVVIVERWASLTSLHAHLAAPHMAAYRERVAGLVGRVSLQVLQPA